MAMKMVAVRDWKTGGVINVKLSFKKAIRLFCLECVCGEVEGIRECTAPLCPLYSFRPYKKDGEDEKDPTKVEQGLKNASRLRQIGIKNRSKTVENE